MRAVVAGQEPEVMRTTTHSEHTTRRSHGTRWGKDEQGNQTTTPTYDGPRTTDNHWSLAANGAPTDGFDSNIHTQAATEEFEERTATFTYPRMVDGYEIGMRTITQEPAEPLPWESVDAQMREHIKNQVFPDWTDTSKIVRGSIPAAEYKCGFSEDDFSSEANEVSWYLHYEIPEGLTTEERAALGPIEHTVVKTFKDATGEIVDVQSETVTVQPGATSEVFVMTALDSDKLKNGGKVEILRLPMEVNCPELYMFSGHTGDKVELCKASGTCEWKLKSASPAIGTFDHPTDLACSFTATTKGKNTIQLIMDGNVVWEKPTEVIEIVTRAGWGAVAPNAHTQTMPDFQHVTLHHTSNANTGAAEMQRIQQKHMSLFPYFMSFGPFKGLNFDDIGYHFIMDKAGVVYEGRQLEVAPGAPGGPYTKGEHVATNNTVAGIGFCTMGDYEATEGNEAWPATRQKDLEKAVSALCRRYKLPASKLSYHKVMALAASPSSCPGSNYIPSIPDIIKHVTENLQ